MAKKAKKKKATARPASAPASMMQRQRLAQARQQALAPRLGDWFQRQQEADNLRLDALVRKIQLASISGTEVLSLARCNLADVPDELRRADLPRLAHVDASHNRLFSSANAMSVLAALRGLRVLKLGNNWLNGPLSMAVGDLVSLEELGLEHNKITSLPEEIGSLTRLRKLNVQGNMLLDLPDGLGSCVELVAFNCRENQIAELPATICNCVQLRRLFAGSNLLLDVPLDIGQLTQLEEFDVRKNAISALPPSLAQCTELRRLHAGRNRLTSFPDEIAEALTQLTELHLYNNNIAVLPAAVGGYQNLTRLSLASNRFRHLPPEIGALSNLAELSLSNCKNLVSLPKTGGLSSLRELSLRDCTALGHLPEESVNWSNLRFIDLRCTKKDTCAVSAQQREAWGELCQVQGGKAAKGGKKKGKKAKK